jgi:hypothetical protein
MARQCTFCERNADSLEHFWAEWLLERIVLREPISISFGKSARKFVDNPKLRVRSVCKICNNGWMSQLESKNIAQIGSLAQNVFIPLDTQQQTSIALWATKTVMVLDSIRKKPDRRFYRRKECEQLRQNSLIPELTFIWLGMYPESSLGLFGTDVRLFDQIPETFPTIGHGCVNTIVVGHLTIQVLTIHLLPEYSDRTIEVGPNSGDWSRLTLRIWPIEKSTAWPPSTPFTGSGPLSIGQFVNRWKRGKLE